MTSDEAKPRWPTPERPPLFMVAHDRENLWRSRGAVAIREEMEAALQRWTPKPRRSEK